MDQASALHQEPSTGRSIEMDRSRWCPTHRGCQRNFRVRAARNPRTSESVLADFEILPRESDRLELIVTMLNEPVQDDSFLDAVIRVRAATRIPGESGSGPEIIDLGAAETRARPRRQPPAWDVGRPSRRAIPTSSSTARRAGAFPIICPIDGMPLPHSGTPLHRTWPSRLRRVQSLVQGTLFLHPGCLSKAF